MEKSKEQYPTISSRLEINDYDQERVTVFNRDTKRSYVIGRKEYNILINLDGSKSLEDIRKINNDFNVTQLRALIIQFEKLGLLNNDSIGVKQKIWKMNISLVNGNKLIKSNSILTKILYFILVYLSIPIFCLGLATFIFKIGVIRVNYQDNVSFFKSIIYIVVFLILLTIHELAHAVVSRKYNANVPEIGVLFYFFIPFVYTNLTFTRLLKSKWQQLMCLLGGIFSNLLISGICMGIACIDGFAYSVFFEMIALLNIVLVLINLIIFFKLDGYYVFQLIQGESNLHEKSIAYVKNVIQIGLNKIKNRKAKVKIQRKTDYQGNGLFYFVFGLLSIGYIPIIFICVALTIWNSIF